LPPVARLCRKIARHYAEYRVSRAMARKQKAAEEVRRIAWELHAKGIRLTRQHLRPLLTSSDYLNIDDGALSAAGGPAADNRAD